MKTATVRDLRNEFGRISKWLERGETVQVVKRGLPFARIVPESKPRTFVGACPGTLPHDLDAPVGVGWDAER
jgi:antitoxin (DNA-binding transcriptional repressor) of toxin-antitoxin stability system